MAHCKVYGTKPSSGPGQLTCQAAMDDVNEGHATWLITMVYDASITTVVYTSAVASADELETAFTPKFSGYTVSY